MCVEGYWSCVRCNAERLFVFVAEHACSCAQLLACVNLPPLIEHFIYILILHGSTMHGRPREYKHKLRDPAAAAAHAKKVHDGIHTIVNNKEYFVISFYIFLGGL